LIHNDLKVRKVSMSMVFSLGESVGERSDEAVNTSLEVISKSAGLIFLGALIASAAGFVSRWFIVRNLLPAEYGVFALTITIMSIASTLMLLGLPIGIPRFVAHYLGKRDMRKISKSISSSLCAAAIAGVIGAVIVFFGANAIASLFGRALTPLLQIMAITLPFSTIFFALLAVFQGFSNMRPKVLYSDVLLSTLQLLLVIIVVIISASLISFVLAYAIALVLAFIFLITFSYNRLKIHRPSSFSMVKNIILFSAPLFVLQVFSLIMGWTDTLMLGMLTDLKGVGIYNVAVLLAQFVPIGITIIKPIVLPEASALIARKKTHALRQIYASSTKLSLILTFPAFMACFLASDQIIQFLFGVAYAPASMALRILALAFFIHVLVGPHGMVLVALKKQKYIAVSLGLAALINIILNYLLIPQLGLTGAALASAIAILFVHTSLPYFLYKKSGVHAFHCDCIKPLILSTGASVFVYILCFWFAGKYLVFVFPVLLLFLYPLALVLTKSVNDYEMRVIKSVLARIISAKT